MKVVTSGEGQNLIGQLIKTSYISPFSLGHGQSPNQVFSGPLYKQKNLWSVVPHFDSDLLTFHSGEPFSFRCTFSWSQGVGCQVRCWVCGSLQEKLRGRVLFEGRCSRQSLLVI